MTARDELVAAIAGRYSRADRTERRKRLRPLVPVLVEAMERHGHLRLAPEVRISPLAMSAATIDRALEHFEVALNRECCF